MVIGNFGLIATCSTIPIKGETSGPSVGLNKGQDRGTQQGGCSHSQTNGGRSVDSARSILEWTGNPLCAMSIQLPPDDGTVTSDGPVAGVEPGSRAVPNNGSNGDSAMETQPEAGAKKLAPPEKPSDVRRRSHIILSFWLIVLCLGLPIWWKTTTIYRADLPLQEMLAWSDGKVRSTRLLLHSLERHPAEPSR